MRRLQPQRRECDRAPRLVLASGSPRRAELLAAAGQEFTIAPSGISETPRPGESPRDLAARLAREKAVDVASRAAGSWVLGADTIVVVDDDALGKPRDERDAVAMLRRLSGRAHHVITAFALVAPSGAVAEERAVATDVVFRTLAPDEIDCYVAGGEPLDKAGAYAIQGGASAFVREIRGSLSNVIGLPMEEVERALRAAGMWRCTSEGTVA